MGRRSRMANEILILRFFKFLVTKLPDRNIVFDIARGTVRNKAGGEARINKARLVRKNGKLLISVKDPFLKRENHGLYMREENNFNRLIIKLKQFIREASIGNLEDFLLESEAEQDDEEDRQYAVTEAEKAKQMKD
jgi:hypothetical protein